MATLTATYSFQLPTVGGDVNLWGGYLNSNFEDLDDLLDGTTPVTGIDINSGSIDGTPIGATSASTGAFTTLTASATATFGTVDINGGAIDGTPIGASAASTGAFTTVTATGDVDAEGFNTTSTVPNVTLNDTNVTNLSHRVAGAADAGLRLEVDQNNVAAGSFLDVFIDGAQVFEVLENGNATATGTVSGSGLYAGASVPEAQLHVEESEATAYNGSATDGQLSAGATAFIQQTAGSNTALAQLVFQPRSGFPYNRIVSTGGSAPLLAFVTNNAEQMRIAATGEVSIGNTSTANELNVTGTTFTGDASFATNAVLAARQDSDQNAVLIDVNNASYTNNALNIDVSRAASTAYDFAVFTSGAFADTEFSFRGDGEAFADGSWTGGGADYAEYFEWADGNPLGEDRVGQSVVLSGDKIRRALPGETPIGVISGNPSMVGDADGNRWMHKYQRDDYGRYKHEEVAMVGWNDETEGWCAKRAADLDPNFSFPSTPEYYTETQRQINPAYDPDAPYVPREQRNEWTKVGLLGKLRIRKGEQTAPSWVKMRDVSPTVEEWLVK